MDPEEAAPVLLHLLDIKGAAAAPACRTPKQSKPRPSRPFTSSSPRASLRRPMVLVLEDLHWVDRISEELRLLAENFREIRILLVATYRPGYRPPWIEKSYAAQIPLPPLSRTTARKSCVRCFGSRTSSTW